MVMKMVNDFPRPLLPTNLKSLNLASWFFMTAVQFLISPLLLSSFPHFTLTRVPSGTSWKVKTLKAVGRALLLRQWLGRGEHRMHGDPVWMRSPFSPSRDSTTRSGISTSLSPMLGPNTLLTLSTLLTLLTF